MSEGLREMVSAVVREWRRQGGKQRPFGGDIDFAALARAELDAAPPSVTSGLLASRIAFAAAVDPTFWSAPVDDVIARFPLTLLRHSDRASPS